MNRVTFGVAWALLAACSDASITLDNGTSTAAPLLETITVQAEPVALETVLDGTLEAVHQSTVAAQTSARVAEMPFDVGDYVEKGDVIVRFRGKEQEARLASAEAGARAARAQLDEAQTEFHRIQDIFDKGLVAKAALDKAEAAMKSARARLEAAQAAAAEAREGAEHTVVRAPYSGIVVKRHIEIGETATVGKPLMTGLSLEHLRVSLQVPQQDIAPLRANQEARVLLPGGRSVTADSVRISPQADPGTHTFHVQVNLPVGQHAAYPGMLVKVAITRGETQALLVPAQSVVQRSEVTGVYVVDEAGVSLRYVRVGSPAPDGRVPVLAGLSAGERIALDPIAAGVELKQAADGS